MHRFLDSRLQKCRNLENGVRGPQKSLQMSLFDIAYHFLLTFYCNYGCISVVSEIPVLNVVKYRDLEIAVKSQSRSLKVVPFNRLGMISYQCSIVNLSLRRDIRLVPMRYSTCKYAVILKPGLGVTQGQPSRIDPPPMTSY